VRADAGLMPRRALGWPLLAVLGAHLLLAWWWLAATGVRALPSIAPVLREFLMVPVRLPPAPVAPPAPTVRAVPRALPRAALPAPAKSKVITVPAAQPAPAPSSSPPVSDALAEPTPTDPTAITDDSLAGRARRTAGSADHELRKGKLAPLAPTDTPWKRLAQGIEGARIDESMTQTSESYTSPDGTIVYRFRKNGRYYCRTGGSVRPSMFGAIGGGATLFDNAGGGGTAGLIACPSGVKFKRD